MYKEISFPHKLEIKCMSINRESENVYRSYFKDYN